MQRLEPIYRFQINNENAEGFSYWLEQHQLFTRAAAAGFFQNKLPEYPGISFQLPRFPALPGVTKLKPVFCLSASFSSRQMLII